MPAKIKDKTLYSAETKGSLSQKLLDYMAIYQELFGKETLDDRLVEIK
jgi:hypothetical protein